MQLNVESSWLAECIMQLSNWNDDRSLNAKLSNYIIQVIMPFFYSCIELFAWYSCKLVFKDITLIQPENIPNQGPTIVYGNHNNQFVDGILLLNKVPRPVSFIAADISMKRPVIGQLLKAAGSIPVKRPQDQKKQKGPGFLVQLQDRILMGKNTKFTELTEGTSIYLEDNSELKIKKINSDTEVEIRENSANFHNAQHQYKVLIKLHFDSLFEKVWEELSQGKCIGIFPEGRSHDLLEIQPFKAGIAMMALGAMEKYGKPVKLVPCGFNYYKPDRFRSKVIMEYGPTYEVPQELVDLYRRDKRAATEVLLQTLQKMLKNVTMHFDSYNELFALFQARQLYTMKSKRKVSIKQQLQLNRRFARGFMLLREDPKYVKLYNDLLEFAHFVHISGLPVKKDDLYGSKIMDFFKFVVYLTKCLTRTVLALPGLITLGPVTKYISFRAERIRAKFTQKHPSSNKNENNIDMVTSEKIRLSLILMPLVNAGYSCLLYFLLKRYTKISKKTILLLALALFSFQPFYIVFLVKSYDSFSRSWEKLKFEFLRLFKPNHYKEFNNRKKQLQKRLLQAVDEIGSKVVENFQENRVLKKEDMEQSELLIEDPDKLNQ